MIQMIGVIKSLIKFHTKVAPETSVEKIWKLLARRSVTLVPVVSSQYKLLGVIGEDDLLFPLVPDYRNYFSEFLKDSPDLEDIEEKLNKEILLEAQDVMNKKVIAIHANQPIFKALSKMMAYHIRALPVVDDDDRYLGLVLEDDIMVYLFEKHNSWKKSRSQ